MPRALAVLVTIAVPLLLQYKQGEGAPLNTCSMVGGTCMGTCPGSGVNLCEPSEWLLALAWLAASG
jgi:hypothetical protein